MNEKLQNLKLKAVECKLWIIQKFNNFLYWIKWLGILAGIFLVLFFAFFRTTHYLIVRYPTITIEKAYETEGQKFIYANNSTFEVDDSYLDFQWNSRDLYGKLQVGHTYQVKTRGVRWGWLSIQPNITKIYKEIKKEEPQKNE